MAKRTIESALARLRRRFAGCSTFGALPIQKAASALKLEPAALQRLIDGGGVLAVRVRGEVMVPNSELERWATRQGW